MKPSYISMYREGTLSNRVTEALAILKSCTLCPHECGVNRNRGETGRCRTGRKAKVASYSAHFGEERPLVGISGSGTIFMSSCNLLCSFCQNWEISHLGEGIEAGPEELGTMMLLLQKQGCHNINFVTPTHVVPQILEALLFAVHRGLEIPLVYNSSGYEKVETLKMLEDIFDIYMPDFKFWGNEWSLRYCDVSDYREVVISAIKEMHRQRGDMELDERGIAEKGLIIRHLVMPNEVCNTPVIMKFISKEISPNTYVNLMDQYRPCGNAGTDGYINRRLTPDEFEKALNSAGDAGLKRLDRGDERISFFRI
ncbi:MAG: radical SAM protein [Spirochaetales bacterium]|nr:radical SAM protein [Spirochaetales bacterium]